MKKGFSLVELLIAMSIITIFITVESTTFFKSISSYKNLIVDMQSEFYINEALMFIEHEIKSNTQQIAVHDNKIDLYRTEQSCIDSIFFRTQNGKPSIVISYTQSGWFLGVNNIINNVKDFKVQYHPYTVFLTITALNGKKYERCFFVKL